MKLSLIAAISDNFVIGKDRGMPWHMPADLKYFFRTTRGHHVLMGRRTFHEFGVSKPLPDRVNMVVSREKCLTIEGAVVMGSIEEAIDFARKKGEHELFIIGGGKIYQQTINIADRLYLSFIHTQINDGDTFFPSFNEKEWDVITEEAHTKDVENPYDYTFRVYERRTL